MTGRSLVLFVGGPVNGSTAVVPDDLEQLERRGATYRRWSGTRWLYLARAS